MPLKIEYRKDAAKYLDAADATTKQRIKAKLAEVATDPYNPSKSLPLISTDKRKVRVGKYRILVLVTEEVLLVVGMDSRGQIYREL
jgi:mRNA interferase RelE/StbE